MSTSSPPSEQTGTAELTTDERHRLLANGRRRAALAVLTDRTVPVDLADLAVAVANRETDAGAADERLVDRVTASLHHAHLPKMDSLGVVEYEPETCRVETYRPVPDAAVT